MIGTIDTLRDSVGRDATVTPYADGDGFPVFLEATDPRLREDPAAVAEWVAANWATLNEALSAFGVLVLRGFAVHTTKHFASLTAHLPSMDLGYAGGNTKRDVIDGQVFETTALPASERIALHQEMAYLPQYPSKLAFFCMKPAETGGATTIGDMRLVASEVPQTLVDAISRKGLKYVRNFRSQDSTTGDELLDAYHKTWNISFRTDDPAEVEQVCRARGLRFEWQPDGSVTVENEQPGFVDHPLTGEHLWFSYLQLAWIPPFITRELYERCNRVYAERQMTRPYQVTFGDGTPIDSDEIAVVAEIMQKRTVGFPWQHADVMFVDNFVASHGRSPFTGSRDIQVTLVA